MAFFGVTSRNEAQKYAMQAAINDKPFLFITGPAGGGKTLIPMSVGLERTIESYDYRRMIYTRMQTQVGENLGALPGNIDEKTFPFIAPFMDNLEALSDDAGVIKRYILEGDEDKRKIFFDPIQTIRGRSLNHTFLLSDESQNIDVPTMAAIASRIVSGSKFVFVGNFSQIDTPKLRNPKNNGLYQLLNGLYEQGAYEYFDHVNFTEQQRHPVVDVVERILRTQENIPEEFERLEAKGNIVDFTKV